MNNISVDQKKLINAALMSGDLNRTQNMLHVCGIDASKQELVAAYKDGAFFNNLETETTLKPVEEVEKEPVEEVAQADEEVTQEAVEDPMNTVFMQVDCPCGARLDLTVGSVYVALHKALKEKGLV